MAFMGNLKLYARRDLKTFGKHLQKIYFMQGPYRHYVLNAIWILINLLCIMLTIFHLRKLYMDYTKTNIEALRVHRLFSVTLNMEKQAR